MNDIDHKAEAEAILFADRQYRDERTLMEAQVSATLYLAEQQRIANLIAVATAETNLLRPLSEASEFAPMFTQIREALGLS